MANKSAKIKAADKVDPSTADFGTICVCAVRYALGRMTYMPSLVQGFIIKYLPSMEENALFVIARDVEEFGGPAHNKKAYGMDCDYDDWMRFLAVVKAELDRRESNNQR